MRQKRSHLEKRGHEYVPQSEWVHASDFGPWWGEKIEIFICGVCGRKK